MVSMEVAMSSCILASGLPALFRDIPPMSSVMWSLRDKNVSHEGSAQGKQRTYAVFSRSFWVSSVEVFSVEAASSLRPSISRIDFGGVAVSSCRECQSAQLAREPCFYIRIDQPGLSVII